jgi:DNA-directed RNA polymerase subunit alpha
VVEDATDIILNLKQIPFKLHSNEPKTLRISRLEPGELLSGHIETDADVEVLDPNVHLATVSEGGNLSIEMRLKRGRGYVPADRNFDDDLPVGYIPVDSVHSPVKKVNFQVEAARLGQDTDYDKLTLEVWTNGSVTPERAIGLAAKLIKDHMTIFINFEEDVQEQIEPLQSRTQPAHNENLDRSVDELELSVRAYNCLKNSDIKTIRDLVQKSESEMLKTKNFGRKSLNEIKDILASMGLGLGVKFDDHGNVIAVSGGE